LVFMTFQPLHIPSSPLLTQNHPQGQHERAVEWFRRALRLDRCCVAAWTLMGHEYVEMRNAPAAIGAGGPSRVKSVMGMSKLWRSS
jgi:hypothetical protein